MSAVAIYLIISMLLVLYFDVSRYIIPNWLVGLMLASYPAAVLMAHHPVDWKMAIAGMGLVLVAGYIVFAMKWMGGGDIKLITACALWTGLRNLPDFLIVTAVIGGIFAVSVWGIRKALPFIPLKKKPLPRILQNGEPVPYGVAISIGFLLMLLNGKIPAVL